MHKLYNVSSSDVFNSRDYPEMSNELAALSETIRLTPGNGKVLATISFLKDHRMDSAWVKSNAVLVGMIRAGKVSCLESMFVSCRHNAVFLRDFEKYISDELHK